MLLVKYSGNWADEMDVCGFKLMSESEYEDLKSTIKSYFKSNYEYIFYVGTNEDIEYHSAKEVINTYTITSLSTEEFQMLIKLFPDKEFGCFLDFDIDEEDEED